jgi:hypothetical protein
VQIGELAEPLPERGERRWRCARCHYCPARA